MSPASARSDDSNGNDPLELAVRAAQAGSQEGWTRLHALCVATIRGLVRRTAAPQLIACEDLDDLVNLVFWEMAKRLHTFEYRSRREFFGWISRVVRSTVAERGRYHGAFRRQSLKPLIRLGPAEGPDAGNLVASPQDGPAAQAQHRDECAALMRYAQQCTADDRALMALFLEHDGNMSGIACALGIGPAAARMRWNRVRRRLRSLALPARAAA